MRVLEKTTKNSERLGRQVRPGNEPGKSCLPVFEHRSAQPLLGPRTDNLISMPYPGPLVQQSAILRTASLGRLGRTGTPLSYEVQAEDGVSPYHT